MRQLRSAATAAVLLALLALTTPWVACMNRPPSRTDDICSIFREKRSWHRSAKASFERWGVPEAVQLSIIHQESSFRADARPPRRRVLWIFPAARRSSAYGYGQVLDPTWQIYRDQSGSQHASRADFEDVTDFIGWYGDWINRRTGVAKNDAANLYLAYHEGPGGYRRGTHLEKPPLARVARKVSSRAGRYQQQYDACREDLSRRRFFGLF